MLGPPDQSWEQRPSQQNYILCKRDLMDLEICIRPMECQESGPTSKSPGHQMASTSRPVPTWYNLQTMISPYKANMTRNTTMETIMHCPLNQVHQWIDNCTTQIKHHFASAQCRAVLHTHDICNFFTKLNIHSCHNFKPPWPHILSGGSFMVLTCHLGITL